MDSPLRLVQWSEVEIPEQPWSGGEGFIGRCLLQCMYYNPDPHGKVDKDTIESVVLVKDEGPPEGWEYADFIWVARLKDGTNWLIEGWHDSTGWDCQSNATYTQLKGEERY